jgi:16S rRNA processing protein RimM
VSDLIPFGILIKPHGLKGHISCRFFNQDSKILKKDSKIYFEDDKNKFLTIEKINYQSKAYLIKFVQILNRNEIDKYKNIVFYIEKNRLPILSDNENYFIDYIGSILFNQDKIKMGIVKDIIPIKDNDVLLFEDKGNEKMIPFAKELILFFDKDNKQLVMMTHSGVIE